jgi:hypothetical protein
MTVSQCRVSAREWRMLRRQRAAILRSKGDGPCRGSLAATVVLVLVVVVLGLDSVFLEAVAAPAAVAMPANASSSPQARIERRKTNTSWSLASRRPNGRDNARGRAPLGAAYAIGLRRVTAATFVLC